MMRKLAKLRKDEAGYTLVWVLVVLIVSGLILIPLLLLMTAGLTSSQIREESTQRFYAADAGIEDGAYKVLNEEDLIPGWPAVGFTYGPYPLGVEINGSSVEVEIYREAEATYKITSTATDNGKSTSIESYVSRLDFTMLFDSAITSLNDIELSPGTIVDGDVTCGGSVGGPGEVTGDVNENAAIDYWPTAEQISTVLRAQVAGLVPFPDAIIDVDDIQEIGGIRGIGPLYRNGPLEITNTDSKNAWTATLQGTVYVTGELKIGTEAQAFTLDLNGHTIYVDDDHPTNAITIGDKCSLSGSGAIIARGGIYFNPHVATESSDYIFLMSIEGTVNFQPYGTFYGAVAGDVEVDLQPGASLVDPTGGGDTLNFPGSAAEVLTYTIE